MAHERAKGGPEFPSARLPRIGKFDPRKSTERIQETGASKSAVRISQRRDDLGEALLVSPVTAGVRLTLCSVFARERPEPDWQGKASEF